MLVGYPPGGAPDLVARALAEQLQARGGRPVVVENRSGANGQIAMETTRNASGLTVVLAPTEAIALNPHVKRTLPYDTFADFTPIASISSNTYGLAVGPLAPVKSIQEFATWCKANPEKATYGTPGVGTPHHLLGQYFGRAAGFEFRHIAYRGGGDVLQDVQGGTVASLIAALPLLITRQKPGVLTVIGMTGEVRDPALPDVATFAEAGYPTITADGSFGLFTSSKTPTTEVARLAELTNAIVRDPAFEKSIAKFGQKPHPLSVDEFKASLRQQFERWKAVVQDIGFKPED